MEREALTNSINPLFFFFFGFAGGIFLTSFIFVPPLMAVFILLIGSAILLAEKIHNERVASEAFILSLLFISFSLGSLRYAIKDFHEPAAPSESGVVISEPEDKENSERFVFLADNHEKVLVSAPLYTKVEYGDRIKVSGKLERPGIIASENGGRDFDYGKYLAKDDIYWTLGFAHIEVLGKSQGNPIKLALIRIKHSFIEQTQKILPEPQAGLLTGLIVAGRGALPADVVEEFRRAGVVHIVVLSGFNITLIAEFLRRAFNFIFLKLKWIRFPAAPSFASILGVLLFVVMTGGEATVVRAALMALTVIVAGLFGRNYSASRTLFFAGFLMLLENPKILVFDPSFQLSFLATLGLIYVMPPLERFLKFVTDKWQLRETLAQTVATQATVLPLLVYSVGDVSLVSLPANLLILLIVPWTMLVGFAAVLISYLSQLLAWPVALITHLMLSWILFVSHFLGSLPFATVSIPHASVLLVAFLYLGLTFIIFRQMILSACAQIFKKRSV